MKYFSNPQISFAGLNKKQLEKRNIFFREIIYEPKNIDHNIIKNHKNNLIKLFISKKDKIVGATIVGEKASQIIELVKIMIDHKIKFYYLIDMMMPYPSFSYGLKYAAIEDFFVVKLHKKRKKKISRIFLRH